MSNVTLQDNNRGRCAVVGYDNGLQTFYARIYESGGGAAARDEEPLIWLGTSPYEIASAEALAVALSSEFTISADVIARLETDASHEKRPPSALQQNMFGLIKSWSGGE